jgi:hypothetical protein
MDVGIKCLLPSHLEWCGYKHLTLVMGRKQDRRTSGREFLSNSDIKLTAAIMQISIGVIFAFDVSN